MPSSTTFHWAQTLEIVGIIAAVTPKARAISEWESNQRQGSKGGERKPCHEPQGGFDHQVNNPPSVMTQGSAPTK